jgi:zinc transport system substrate-binding protein
MMLWDDHSIFRSGHYILILAVFCFFIGILLTAGCTEDGTAPARTPPLTVAVTIPPQKQFVERVGGDRVQVIVLVPPGASPHTHEPTPGQLAAIGRADLYIAVGSGIEFERTWMDKIRAINPGMPVIDSSEGVELITGNGYDGGKPDPHIWLSPRSAMIMVENTYQGIAAVDPDHESLYRENRDAYLAELGTLDREISQSVAGRENRKIMVYHPAWAYLARDYNLDLIPIEEEGKDPTPRGLEELVRQARENMITVIFASPEFSTRSAEAIAGEIGGQVVLVSPLEEDYVGNLRRVSSAFAGV